MIKLQILGNLGKDATVNTVNSKQVINFSVCHTDKYKDSNGVVINKSTWVDVSYWADSTKIAFYLKQGTQVFCEGQPDVRGYTNRDGKPGVSLCLRASHIQLLGSPNKTENTTQQSDHIPDNTTEDLPF